MKISVSNVVVALILLFGGYSLGQNSGPVQIVTVMDTVSLADLNARLQAERREVSRLRGITRSQPDTVLITDTVVTPPDTIITFVSVRDGKLTTSWLTGDTLYTPSITVHTLDSCDDGFELSGNGLLCDRALFGHLWVGPVLDNMDPMLSAWWKPTYQSPWEIGVGYGKGLRIYGRFGLKLF